MANIKSAKKRILVIKTKTERNKAIKSKVKTYVKKVLSAIESGNKDQAKVALNDAYRVIQQAASKGVFHKKNAARKMSKLSIAVNNM